MKLVKSNKTFEILDFSDPLKVNIKVADLDSNIYYHELINTIKDKKLWKVFLRNLLSEFLITIFFIITTTLFLVFYFLTASIPDLSISEKFYLIIFSPYFFSLFLFFFIITFLIGAIITCIKLRNKILNPFDHAIKKAILERLYINYNKYDLDMMRISKKNKFSN
ncbi:hypothetical protein A7M79_00205 [Acinetobacter baumannii]|uniref:hypothetical protein n=1 Tax=Acinetobacter baumannii TaxID=470 RepID=UPI0008DE358F|nr:hypothetical protein [Acinetobacter baumannii]OIH11945.1 hypothetical protein A7M79_00205 [Acinetobacter baumannii]